MNKQLSFINPTTENIFSIAIPKPKESVKSFFLFSAHKAGSTLLSNLLSQYCQKIKFPIIDIPSVIYNEGEDIQRIKLLEKDNKILNNGYGYIGWRSYWNELPKATTNKSNNILLIRDPRDRIVSLYFSLAFSHIIPSKGIGMKKANQQRNNVLKYHDINDWIQDNPNTVNSLDLKIKEYLKKLPYHSTRIYRYEDVIYRKKEWMIDMIDYLNLPKNNWQIKSIVRNNDIIPTEENKDKHIRQVNPGNYIKHLNLDTINYLNAIYEEQLNLFNYIDRSTTIKNRICFAHEGQEVKKILKE